MKIETRIVSPGPLGMAVSVRRVNGDSSTQEFEYTTNLDGKSYAMIGQGPYGANSIAANLTLLTRSNRLSVGTRKWLRQRLP